MIIDAHVHIMEHKKIDQNVFVQRLGDAGIDEVIIFSLPPASQQGRQSSTDDYQSRLDNLFRWQNGKNNIHPFFWIDPLADDAIKQVGVSVDRGVQGFKIICDKFYPDNEKAMKVYRAIAETHKPIMFHSGILWDGKNSSRYNRPVVFEALLEIKRLKFSLAHISWPWCDELIALYGKVLNSYSKNPDISAEMFIDTTPGTPEIYRKDALKKVFTVGYDVVNNIFFGSDSRVNDYNIAWTKKWVEMDTKILSDLNLEQSHINAMFSENVRRFLGLTDSVIKKKVPLSGEIEPVLY